MTYALREASIRRTIGSNVASDLVIDWATRVMALWEKSRAERPSDTDSGHDLAEACRVRDELNNRLTQMYPDEFTCAEESLRTLRDADAFFLQFTVESCTAESLSLHNHYAHRAQWWCGVATRGSKRPSGRTRAPGWPRAPQPFRGS